MTIKVIFTQNDMEDASRTGSPMDNTIPVIAMTGMPIHIHGENRFHTAANVSSVLTNPSTRSVIMNTAMNTTPIITM